MEICSNPASPKELGFPSIADAATKDINAVDCSPPEIKDTFPFDVTQLVDEGSVQEKVITICDESRLHINETSTNERLEQGILPEISRTISCVVSSCAINDDDIVNIDAIQVTTTSKEYSDLSSLDENIVFKTQIAIPDIKCENIDTDTNLNFLPKSQHSMQVGAPCSFIQDDLNGTKSNASTLSLQTANNTDMCFSADFVETTSPLNTSSPCQQNFEFPIILDKCELDSKLIESVPIVASECVIETEYPLQELSDSIPDLELKVSDSGEERDLSISPVIYDIQQSTDYICSVTNLTDAEGSECGLNLESCVQLAETCKKERQSLNCDETVRRRSSRIAEKKHLRSQKDASNKIKVEQDRDIKDTSTIELPEKTIPDHEAQETKKHFNCENEKLDDKFKGGKRGYEKDHAMKSPHGSSRLERHESTKQTCCKRDGKLDGTSVKNNCRLESNKCSNNRDCVKIDRINMDKTNSPYKSKNRSCNQPECKNGHPRRNALKEGRYFTESSGRSQRRRSQSASEKCSDSNESVLRRNTEAFNTTDSFEGSSLEQEDKQKKNEDVQKLTVPDKKDAEDRNILKPEKVKSRWRRNSELEHGGLSSTSTNISSEYTDSKSPDFGRMRENLSPISEEQTIHPETPEKSDEPKEKPPQYGTTEDNIYLFERKRSKSKKEVRRMVCDCSLTKEEKDRGLLGCEGDCLNRLLMIECGSRCATGDSCSNKRFQKKQFAKTEPFKTERKGWGLRVLEDVSAGKFVMEYVGEVLNPQDFKQRVKQYAREKYSHYYFMALRRNEIIDATNKGNLSRFINHSCDPNCETQKWTVNGELRIGFFTRRDVNAGDELTFDYQFQRYGKEAQKCFCESVSCRGYIGEDKQISLDSYSSSKSSNRRKKSGAEDLTLEEKIEKLSVSRGLRNREETLVLARLMVIAEDIRTRHRLLDIILTTTELPCLRLFLDYQGLPLIWSWMVDAVDSKLRTKLLKVLSILPVPNKTMLMDSKVINVVQKWWHTLSVKKTDFVKENEITETEQSSDSPSEATTPCGGEEIPDPLSKKIKLTEHLEGEADISSYLRLRETESILFPASSITAVRLTAAFNQPTDIRKNDSPVCQFPENSTSSTDKLKSLPGLILINNKNTANENLKMTEAILKSDEDSGDTMDEDEDKKYDAEVSNLASKLLESWSELKEVFRIPRLEQQKRHEDEDAVDNQHHEKEYGVYRDSSKDYFNSKYKDSFRDRDFPECEQNLSKERRHRDKGRDKGKEYDYCQPEKGSVDSPEWRDDRKHFKHSRKSWLNVNDDLPVRPRKALLPTPPRLTKEERRQQFALEVQQRDEQEALRRQQVEQSCVERFQSSGQLNYTTYNQYYDRNHYDSTYNENTYNTSYDPNNPYVQQIPSDCQPTISNSMPPNVALSNEQKPALLRTRTALLPTPTFEPAVQPVTLSVPPTQYSDHSTPLAYPPPPRILFQPAPSQAPFLSAPPPTLGQSAPILNVPAVNPSIPSVTTSIPRINILPHTSVSSAVQSLNHTSSSVSSCTSSISASSAKADSFNTSSSVSVTTSSPLGAAPAQNSVPAAQGYLPNPAQFANSQNRPLFFVHSTNTTSVVNVREQIAIQQTIPLVQTNSLVSEGVSSPVIKVTDVKLPPNWKTARDPEGNVYYYHALTRQTQWDPPSLEENEEMDLGTPTFDEPKLSKKKSTTTAAADTSSEVAKKIKELFRTKMSSFIVQCLNPYRKPDCSVGRINSSDDFKHLARKLTHFVMSKELKHCKNVEDLECNESVKLKAKDFTQKYMAKQGLVYKKDKETSGKCN